ncbi:hypothetical protein ACFUIZ_27575 [Streptomyces cinereoruber]|uniref:hypothetical protein n=1 Tax=Streptomyces cinereoruber TaxID=67260 RepID=UPI00362920D2
MLRQRAALQDQGGVVLAVVEAGVIEADHSASGELTGQGFVVIGERADGPLAVEGGKPYNDTAS